MTTRTAPRLLQITLALLLLGLSSWAQNKPLTYTGLIDALRMHGLTDAELAAIVKARGVDFQLTPEKSSELKAAGADAPLLTAIAAGYRGPKNSPNTPKPQPTTPATQPAAPATVKPAAPSPSAPPVSTSPQPAVAITPPPARPSVNSIRQVKSLYIERMSNNLDEYIKSELSRQLPGRFVVVLRPQDADAIM